MLLKLSVRNVRRSVRDYAVYFATLVFGVAVFYAFNSIGSQQVLFDLEEGATKADIFDTLQGVMTLFSVVVACVLGFLVVYSNRFLVGRRRREFGTYLLLGMSPGAVSHVVLGETCLVGVASLAAGLVAGVLLSQALSFATAALLNMTMEKYRFVFSPKALVATLACFTVIFAVVALLNLIMVNRFRIVDLVSAHEKSEKAPMRNPIVCLVAFVASLVVLAAAYQNLAASGMEYLDDPRFIRATVFMLVGTLLFFWSLSGFVIGTLQRVRSVYLRGLTAFTIRQIASKVNTAFLSLWAICVLLFFSLTTFSVGMGMMDALTGSISEAAPYDATVRGIIPSPLTTGDASPQTDAGENSDDAESADAAESFDAAESTGNAGNIGGAECLNGTEESSPSENLDASENSDPSKNLNVAENSSPSENHYYAEARTYLEETYPELYEQGERFGWSMEAALRSLVPNWDDLVESTAEVDFYVADGLTGSALYDAVPNLPREGYLYESVKDAPLQFVSASQYQAAVALAGGDAADIAADEILVVNNLQLSNEVAQALAASGSTLVVDGHELSFVEEVDGTQLLDSATPTSILVLVVDDSVIEGLVQQGALPTTSYLNVKYAQDGNAAESAFANALASVTEDAAEWSEWWPCASCATQRAMFDQSDDLRMLITYLALYVGMVFLVSTAAILAIQQLSEAVDSQRRYRTLSKLGCDMRMLDRSLFAQVLVYFLAPLGLACCHAACAIGVVSESLIEALGSSMAAPIAAAAGLTLCVYGVYFLITYFASRSIMQQAIKPGA